MFRPPTALIGVLGVLVATGCDRLQMQQSSEVAASSPASVPATIASPSPSATSTPVSPLPDTFAEAISLASSAFQLGQAAKSQDDWRLVASRWQQAIDLLSAVPTSSPNHSKAQGKLAEYRRNLAYAEQQANKPIERNSGTIVLSPNRTTRPTSPATGNTTTNPRTSSVRPPSTQNPGTDSVFVAPIIARAGGTPVIDVLFNDSATFPMIVDTGASKTLITADMALALNVQPTGEAKVDTASQRDLSLELGSVQSISVQGAIARDLVVAIAGPELDIGLLGHDFFGNYDVTVRQDVVEFRER